MINYNSQRQEYNRRWNYHRFYLLFFIFALCAIFYYFGEIIDFFHWDSLRLEFFYGVHDVHRLIFLIPIVYAAYYFGLMPTIIIIILAICVFLPRAIFVSPYPDPLLRATLFTVFAAAIGIFMAIIMDRYRKAQQYIEKQEWIYAQALNEMEEGVMLVSPDYKVQYVNNSLKKEFGDARGSYCYTYLHNRNVPCADICKMGDVLKGTSSELQCELSGIKYAVTVIPYSDINGNIYQLSIFKRIK
jgi:hypothetical protein